MGVFCLSLFYSATARHEQDAKRLRMSSQYTTVATEMERSGIEGPLCFTPEGYPFRGIFCQKPLTRFDSLFAYSQSPALWSHLDTWSSLISGVEKVLILEMASANDTSTSAFFFFRKDFQRFWCIGSFMKSSVNAAVSSVKFVFLFSNVSITAFLSTV